MLVRNRWFIAAALPALALRAHAHLMLVGLVGMMIFGVALHAGALSLMCGFLLQARALALAGGVLAWAALAIFAARLAPVLMARLD